MKRFWDFLKKNAVYAVIGTTIYWCIPHIVVTLLGIFVSKYFFTLYLAVFGGQVALPAIPIIIGINILFAKWFNADNMIFLDIVFLCVIFVVGELICYMWKQKRNKKGDRLNEK